MRKMRNRLVILRTAAVAVGLISIAGAWFTASAQETVASKSKIAEVKLSEQQTRGEGLFLQRCSLCHLPRNFKFGSPAVVGPSLAGVFKNQNPNDERKLRDFVLKGSLHMPGFRYALSEKEFDDLFAYLKTL